MLGDNFLQVNGGLSARFYSFKRLLLADFSPSQTHRAGKPSSAAFGWWSRGIRLYQAFPLSKCSRGKKDGLRRHAPSFCLKLQAF